MADYLAAIPLGFILSFSFGPLFFILLETSISKGLKQAFLMDIGIESYLLSMNEKDPSELGFENFWKRIKKTEQSTFSDIIKGKLYG